MTMFWIELWVDDWHRAVQQYVHVLIQSTYRSKFSAFFQFSCRYCVSLTTIKFTFHRFCNGYQFSLLRRSFNGQFTFFRSCNAFCFPFCILASCKHMRARHVKMNEEIIYSDLIIQSILYCLIIACQKLIEICVHICVLCSLQFFRSAGYCIGNEHTKWLPNFSCMLRVFQYKWF